MVVFVEFCLQIGSQKLQDGVGTREGTDIDLVNETERETGESREQQGA